MALSQRDDYIDAIKRLDAMLEYAVQHNEPEEADCIRRHLIEQTERT